MKNIIINFFLNSILRFTLLFRYKVEVKGLENIDPSKLDKSGGLLFLPNHPAVLVDPIIVAMNAWKKVPLRPIIVEYMYYLPVVNFAMRFVNALPMPDFETSLNSLKRKQGEEAINEIVKGLKRGENFLIYPAGRLKRSSKEDVGGASGTHQIIQNTPEANIILVRTKGLYGSLFSSAFTGQTPPLFPTLLQGIKVLLKNFIFFAPRRHVIIEFHLAPNDFPYQASRLELNRWLEKWYNKPDGLTPQKGEYPGDSLILVSYSFWKRDIPPLFKPKDFSKEILNMEAIDENVQSKVFAKLQELTEIDLKAIKPEMLLSSDLGLDSLDTSEVALFLQEQFDTGPIPLNELTTVRRVLGFATKQIKAESVQKEEKINSNAWKINAPRQKTDIGRGETIPEVFLNMCHALPNNPACADFRSGILTYSHFKLSVLILAEQIQKMPGQYVGILLPASVAAYLCVLACQFAGKIPVMINWTIGPRHLEAVRALSKLKVVITSSAFIERLDNTDLSGIEDILVMLEDIRKEFTLLGKLKGWLRSKRSPHAVMRSFGINGINKEDEAVLLFTSGTEAMPKGVPLSHENILSNARSTFSSVDLFNDDIMLGILPPFHAYGFGPSGLMGLLSGIRSAYYPNPTDGEGLAKAFQAWGATIMCGAPSFIKATVKAATPEQMKTMRICVTGAEKAPPELFRLMNQIGKEQSLLEGYGVTECSPILTANRPGKPRKGVGSPVTDVEICIVHPDLHELLPTGEKGLVLVRGPNVFKGYLNPGLESPFITVKGKDWYNTGDIGFLDEENRLTLAGRKKRFIKIGGEMISLLSIESELLHVAENKGWPIKEEGPTLAILAKDREGERPHIVLLTTFNTNVEEINIALKQSGFSNLVRVSEVIKLDDIPLMGTGKVNYRVLEEKHLSNGPPQSPQSVV